MKTEFSQASAEGVLYDITIDRGLCTECGLCEAFCPVRVFDMKDGPQVARPRQCWGCETCVGQCPAHAIHIDPTELSHVEADDGLRAEPLDSVVAAQYREWDETLRTVLGMRWHPVAVSLVGVDDPLPEVPIPTERMRYCQSLMAARRGRCTMLPANRHACPDGTSILGLTGIPDKLASGELYVLFHKLDSIEAARQMVAERPTLPERSVRATVACPLDQAACKADVVAIIAQPEQIMWLCMAASYYTGHRHDFHASGYNAQCVETTLLPYVTGRMNVSFGCYGCRASSDVGDECMMMGIPVDEMPTIIKGLRELGKKAIPQSRDKIYLPPL